MPKHPQAFALGRKLKAWCEEHGYVPAVSLMKRAKLPITMNQWEHLLKGDHFLSDISVYAILYRITGIPEIDPRTLPEGPRGFVRAWTDDRWKEWLEKENAALGQDDLDRETPEKPRWAHELAEALRSWCNSSGYIPRTALADELDIPKQQWGTAIITGNSIVQQVEYYACIHLRTDLPQADPRTIPPRTIRIPKTGATMFVQRAWPEEQWQKWLDSDKAQRINKLKQEKVGVSEEIKPSKVATPQQAVQVSVSTLGDLAKEWIDRSANVLVQQLVSAFADQITQKALASSQNAMLPQVVREAVHKELQQHLQQKGETASTPSSSNSSRSLSQLAHQVSDLLEEAVKGTAADRDRLVASHREALRRLYLLLDPFTRDPEQRETQLRLQELGS